MFSDREALKRALDDYVYARMGSAGVIRTPPQPGEHSISAEREADEAAERFLNALVPVVAEAIARGTARDATWAQSLKRNLR